MNRLKRSLLLVLAAAIPLTLGAQLNPTVKVLPRPTSPVPTECDQGLAPQPAQRLTTEERTIVRDTRADLQAPPSAGLRRELQTALAAAQHNNREVFRDALARSRDDLTTYPPGGERTAASELVNVLSDIDTVWSFQFSSPTGAFFDANGDSFRVASRYPGYDVYIRPQIVVDQNGNKFYPTSETLDFLAGEAASRLSRLMGKPAPPRPALRGIVMTPPSHPIVKKASKPSGGQAIRPVPAQTKSTVVQTTDTTKKHVVHHPHSKTHVAKTTATRHVQSPSPASKHESTKIAVKKEPPSPGTKKTETVALTMPAATPHQKAAEVVAKKEPASPTTKKTEPVVPPTPAPSPAPSQTTKPAGATTASTTPSTATTTTASAPTITTPTDTMSSTPPTATESAATSDTSATTSAESTTTGKPIQSRSFFWPIFLIIVGLGVLVRLWRASS
jgi:hypothetical protein